jgi:hypothetical protein
MTQQNPENSVLENYIIGSGFSLPSPDRPLKPPIILTGDIVLDYINAAGFGLPKKTES